MSVVNLTARRKCGKEQTTHAQILKGKDQKKGDNMAFIELESAGVECGRFLINADDIVEVYDGKEERHVYTQRYKEHAEYVVSTFYDDIFNRLMTDGQQTAYHRGWEDGANAAAEHLRLCKKEEPPKMELSEVERIRETIKTKINKLDTSYAGGYVGLDKYEVIEIIDKAFQGDKTCT